MKKLLLSVCAIVSIALILFLLPGCGKGGSTPEPTPAVIALKITSLSPTNGTANTSVIITGTGFSSTIANNAVLFNGKAAIVTAATATQLTVTVPADAGTGTVTVSVSGAAAVTGPVFTYEYTVMVSTLKTADGAPANFTSGLWGIALDGTGNIFVSDIDGFIRELTTGGVLSVFAGHGTMGGDGQGTAAGFNYAAGMKFDKTGNLYVADGNAIRKISASGAVTTFYAEGVPNFTDLAIDGAGNIYATDFSNNLIVKITPAGVKSILAGSGVRSSTDGTGTAATFNLPVGIAIDGTGNLFVVDGGSNKIRKITPAGVVTTIAGSGLRGFTNGIGVSASFNNPSGIAVDGDGNLYIGDFDNHAVRKITPDGTVSTYAGTGIAGNMDGPASTATFGVPQCIAVDANKIVYVADGGGQVRKITLQ